MQLGRGDLALPRRSRASTERWAPLSEGACPAAATRLALARPSKATAPRRLSFLRGTYPYRNPSLTLALALALSLSLSPSLRLRLTRTLSLASGRYDQYQLTAEGGAACAVQLELL